MSGIPDQQMQKDPDEFGRYGACDVSEEAWNTQTGIALPPMPREEIAELVRRMEAILPIRSLSPADFARINAARERCDALVARAQREHDKLCVAAEREQDWRPARKLRQLGREILQAAQSEAAVRILDAQAEAYLPLAGDHFRYQTLEILAKASATAYGGDVAKLVRDAVADRVCEWRARSWERESVAGAPVKAETVLLPAEAVPCDANTAATTEATSTASVTETTAEATLGARRAERRALRDLYRLECKAANVKVTDAMIGLEMKPNSKDPRSIVQHWLRCDPRYQTYDQRIRRFFADKRHLPRTN